MKKVIVLFVSILAVSTTAIAQDVESIRTNSIQMRGTAVNEEIKSDSTLNIVGAEIPVMKSKDEAERGTRYAEFDNWTEWWVRCYIDGQYYGMVAPYSELRIRLPYDATYRLYAEVRFTNASTRYWSGINRYIGSSFQWSLYE